MQKKIDFLSLEDEKNIKQEYEDEKQCGNIDKDIMPILDKLNSIKGLVTLYSCQGHSNKPKSYVALKFSKKISKIVVKIINELVSEYEYVRVDWNHCINCNNAENKKTHNVTVLRGDMDCKYMYLFYEKLSQHIK